MSSSRPPLLVFELSDQGNACQQLATNFSRNRARSKRGNLDAFSQQQRVSTANRVTMNQLGVGMTAARQPPTYSVHRNRADPTANSLTPYPLDVEVIETQLPPYSVHRNTADPTANSLTQYPLDVEVIEIQLPPYSVHRNTADPTANSVAPYPLDFEVMETQLPPYSVHRNRTDPPSYDEVWDEDERQISIISRNPTRSTLRSCVPRNAAIPSNNGAVIGGTTLARQDVGEDTTSTPSNIPSRQTHIDDQELSPSENRPYVIFSLCSLFVCCLCPFSIVLNIGVVVSAFSASKSTDKQKKRGYVMNCILLTFLSFAFSLTIYGLLFWEKLIG